MGKTVVLAIFPDEIAADDSVESLKAWDKADDDVKLNAIGVLVLGDNGKVKTHKLVERSVGKGAGIGLLLAVVAPPTLLAGAIGGGVLGAFHHKGLGLNGADRERLADSLRDGKAAVGVLVKRGPGERRGRQAQRARRRHRDLRGRRTRSSPRPRRPSFRRSRKSRPRPVTT